jgi:hypothetical protein
VKYEVIPAKELSWTKPAEDMMRRSRAADETKAFKIRARIEQRVEELGRVVFHPRALWTQMIRDKKFRNTPTTAIVPRWVFFVLGKLGLAELKVNVPF